MVDIRSMLESFQSLYAGLSSIISSIYEILNFVFTLNLNGETYTFSLWSLLFSVGLPIVLVFAITKFFL